MFVAAVLGLTSLGVFVIGAIGLGLPARGVRDACAHVFDCIGLAVVFMVANVAAGAAAVFLARAVLGRFVSIYVVANELEALLLFSLLQAVAFQGWRHARPSPLGPGRSE